jgi:hypothetical protein
MPDSEVSDFGVSDVWRRQPRFQEQTSEFSPGLPTRTGQNSEVLPGLDGWDGSGYVRGLS